MDCVVSHPFYDSLSNENDIALLRLSEPIKYQVNILPVCVPTGNDSYVDQLATVIGWGRVKSGELHSITILTIYNN